MSHMLKKFENWYKEKLKNKEQKLIKNELEFKNHIIDVNGTNYFLAKGSITDIPDIAAVEAVVYDRKAVFDKKRFLADLKHDKNVLYLLVRKNDKLVAFIACTINPQTKNCRILNIAVLPKFQNHGLGYFLLTTVIGRARNMGLKSVTLTTRIGHTRAQHLNRDLGFVQVGVDPDYYNDDEDAVVMKLDLNRQKVAPGNFGR